MFRKRFLLCVFVAVLTQWVSIAIAASLNVALYPYVPRIKQFRTVIEDAWKQVEPDVPIVWVDGWDGGYNNNPQDSYDLFVFDATYLTYFKNQGWLMGLNQAQVDNFADFLPFARNGVLKEDKVWAIPQLGCTEYLIYRGSDQSLTSSVTMTEVIAALTRCTYHADTPPPTVGLMIDLSGGTTNAISYVKSLEVINNTFPVPLPAGTGDVNMTAMRNLRTILATASLRNAWFSGGDDYQRGLWYGQNHGRAYVGFSESLTRIPSGQLPALAMKVMPWADNIAGLQHPLFYCDAIAVNPKTSQRGTTDLAVKLANLMASAPVIVNCFKAQGSDGPQYLTPVRATAMMQLASMYPMYVSIKAAVEAAGEPILLDLGPNAKTWLASMKDPIKHMVIDELQCYCDKTAGPPMDNAKAQTVCPGVCGSDNWNGQWTNIGDHSVCGCFCGLH
ncbi:MAG: thiamine pyridinylase [Phycisphaerae bacterium]|nr:thiamine pyridinylase [Phycisphaerae bacterium]MDD5380310.1 thiamine pyridinylase [Phycisphaerae bacterium]